ncbi:MarR family transcriptional regulator [Actinophytocola sp.]|uniref:MarR family transcriptional regulator n=1 Tax=Actinophytocola sp. TaxID=1872138 RepID=UPI002ED1FB41
MTNVAQGRGRRRLVTTVKDAVRSLRTELALLNRRVTGRLQLREGDLDLLEVIARLGPMGPSTLARHTALHPATMTGVLDRLEKGGWVTRERDPDDRRSLVLHVRRDRVREILTLYSGMNQALDDLCANYTDDELRVIADFLTRAAEAGNSETRNLDEP